MPRKNKPLSKSVPKKRASARSWLEKQSKKELIKLILKIASEHPRISETLSNKANINQGKIKPVKDSILSNIEELEPDWQEDCVYDAEKRLADIATQLLNLLDAGHADTILEISEAFLSLAPKCYEYYYHDDWLIASRITECLDIMLEALTQSSLSPAEQLLWYIDAVEADEYSIFDDTQDITERRCYKKAVWYQVAEVLEKRLQAKPPLRNDAGYSQSYERERLSGWLKIAMEKGGRESDVIELLLQEAPITKSYVKLVSALITAGRKKEAREWVVEGYTHTIEDKPGISWQLAGQLIDIARKEKNLPEISSLLALEFFYRADIEQYRKLEKSIKKTKCWSNVRSALLNYLETGVRPDLKPKTNATWPLPACMLTLPESKSAKNNFPVFDVLIKIAIHEKQPDDVLKWYQLGKNANAIYDMGISVADAVKSTHPEEALIIWKRKVDKEIARVKVSAYQDAAPYLKKIRTLYRKQCRTGTWNSYLLSIMEQHKAKRRLIEILNNL